MNQKLTNVGEGGDINNQRNGKMSECPTVNRRVHNVRIPKNWPRNVLKFLWIQSCQT